MKEDYKILLKGKLRKYVSKNNQILIDGAHNPLAASAVKAIFRNFKLKEKNIYDPWNDGK